jgi:hypothetical protein
MTPLCVPFRALLLTFAKLFRSANRPFDAWNLQLADGELTKATKMVVV